MVRDHKQCTQHENYIAAKERSLKTQQHQKQGRIEKYLQNPKRCLLCSIVIPYEQKTENNFCNRSCAATYNNNKRGRKQKTVETSKPKKQSRAPRTPKPKKEKYPYTLVYPNKCKVCERSFYAKTNVRKSCSPECTKIIGSITAKRTGLGGNKNNKAHGYYTSPTAGTVWLESSYELKVAQELDNHNIAWSRPSYFNYTLNEQTKKRKISIHARLPQ